jgi:hypothetical protein
MNKFLFVSFLFLSVAIQAQKNFNPQVFANSITAADLKKHLSIIAGREMEGRETATEGQRKAAAYIEGEFKRIGLQPGNNGSYQMNFPLYQDSLLNATFEVNGQRFELDKDFNINLNNIAARQAFSEIVFIGKNVSVDSISKSNLSGKVIMFPVETMQYARGVTSPKMEMIRKANPAAILFIYNNYPRQATGSRKGNQSLYYFKKNISPQQFTISENIAKAIAGNIYAETGTSASSRVFIVNILLEVQKKTINLQSSNVIGVLPGTDLKNEYLFITAHYDHLGKRDTVIYYGADDDGSGTVGVIELAEAYAKAKAAGKGPRRSIVFMTVSGEEKGLLGSEYYGYHPLFPLNKTTADLNIDMIGRSDPDRKTGDSTNYVYVVGDDKISSDLKTLSESQNKKYTKLELDYKYNDPNDKEQIYYRSDHYNFARHGVPIIFYYDGMLRPDYHRPTDTIEKINFNLLTKRTQLVFFTSWEIANRDAMLVRDLPLPLLSR